MSRLAGTSISTPSASALEVLTAGLFDWSCMPAEIQTFCTLAAGHATCDPMRVLSMLLPLFQSLVGPLVVHSTTYEDMVCSLLSCACACCICCRYHVSSAVLAGLSLSRSLCREYCQPGRKTPAAAISNYARDCNVADYKGACSQEQG
jgi:hypothetical protein